MATQEEGSSCEGKKQVSLLFSWELTAARKGKGPGGGVVGWGDKEVL